MASWTFVEGNPPAHADADVLPVTAMPFSLAGWCRPTNVSVQQCLAYLGAELAGGAGSWRINIASDGTLRAASEDNAGSGAVAISATAVAINAWIHVGAVFGSATSRRVFLNGVGRGNGTSVAAPTPTLFTLGAERGSTGFGTGTRGQLEHWACWSAALTDAEMALLAKGTPAGRVRPEVLAAWWPNMGRLVGAVMRDRRGRSPLTVSGGSASDQAPPVRGGRPSAATPKRAVILTGASPRLSFVG